MKGHSITPAQAHEAYVRAGSVHRAGLTLGITGETVRQLIRKGGFSTNRTKWTKQETESLVEYYRSTPSRSFSLDVISEKLGRSFSAVALKASKLGLTDPCRPISDSLRQQISARERARVTPESRARASEHFRRWHATHEHPRGFLGHTRDAKFRSNQSKLARAAWANPLSRLNSPEHRRRIGEWSKRAQKEGLSRKQYSRARVGKRDDLGMYFRSSWEANYARYLNFLILDGVIAGWKYESTVFEFSDGSTYRPDFEVVTPDGAVCFHEVKGWLTEQGARKLELMRSERPEVPLTIIDRTRYYALQREFKYRIKEWE